MGAKGSVFTVDQAVGKTLFAAKYVVAYRFPGSNLTKDIVATFKRGDRIGTVYSYVSDKGKVWWMIETGNYTGPKYYYIQHVSGAFDMNALRQQGFKSTQEIAKEEELRKLNERGTIDKISDSVTKTFENTAKTLQNTSAVAKYAIPVVGVAILLGIGYTAMKKTETVKNLVK